MRPLFRADSDAILVKQYCPGEKNSAEKLHNLDIVLFKRRGPRGEQYVLHRIVGRRSDGCYIIAGDNCTDADIVCPEDILGVVVSAQRGNKRIKLEGFRYGLYKAFWCAPYKFRFLVLKIRGKCRRIAKRILKRR